MSEVIKTMESLGYSDIVKSNGRYYYVDSRDTFDGRGFETMVFNCNNEYKISSWTPVYTNHYKNFDDMEENHFYLINNLEDFLDFELDISEIPKTNLQLYGIDMRDISQEYLVFGGADFSPEEKAEVLNKMMKIPVIYLRDENENIYKLELMTLNEYNVELEIIHTIGSYSLYAIDSEVIDEIDLIFIPKKDIGITLNIDEEGDFKLFTIIEVDENGNLLGSLDENGGDEKSPKGIASISEYFFKKDNFDRLNEIFDFDKSEFLDIVESIEKQNENQNDSQNDSQNSFEL